MSVEWEGGLQVCGTERVRISAFMQVESQFLGNEHSSVVTINTELSQLRDEFSCVICHRSHKAAEPTVALLLF